MHAPTSVIALLPHQASAVQRCGLYNLQTRMLALRAPERDSSFAGAYSVATRWTKRATLQPADTVMNVCDCCRPSPCIKVHGRLLLALLLSRRQRRCCRRCCLTAARCHAADCCCARQRSWQILAHASPHLRAEVASTESYPAGDHRADTTPWLQACDT